MKLRLSREHLQRAISRLKGSVGEKHLACIGIQASDSLVTFFSSDGVLATYAEMEGNIETGGTAFVGAELFVDIVRELPAEEIVIEASQGSCTISSQAPAFVMKLPILKNQHWLEEPFLGEAATSFCIAAGDLGYLISQVLFALVQDSQRSYGGVAFLHGVDHSTIRLVGCDGYRLSMCETSLDGASFLETGISLSKRALEEISRCTKEGPLPPYPRLTLAQDLRSLRLELQGMRLYILLSNVAYPAYQDVLPKNLSHSVVLRRAETLSVIKRVLLAADRTKSLQLAFAGSELTLTSKSNSSDVAGWETVPLSEKMSEPKTIVVHGKHLSDILSAMACDEFCLSFENEDTPIMIIPRSEREGHRSCHVLVPAYEGEE